MVPEWREREHGEVEEAVRADVMAQQLLEDVDSTSFGALVA